MNDSTANRRFAFGVRKRVGGARHQLRDRAAVVGELAAVLILWLIIDKILRRTDS